jgi:hypothetical protein
MAGADGRFPGEEESEALVRLRGPFALDGLVPEPYAHALLPLAAAALAAPHAPGLEDDGASVAGMLRNAAYCAGVLAVRAGVEDKPALLELQPRLLALAAGVSLAPLAARGRDGAVAPPARPALPALGAMAARAR